MLATAAAAWENLQAKSCAGIMNNRNLIHFYTFSPSQMIKQSMVISQFADICKKEGSTDHIQITY
jgi:5,10-methylenetetrahydrofolate reductase